MDIGALPVADHDRLIGDDAHPRGDERRSALCYEDEDLAHIAANMAKLRVRRLPAVDRDKRLVGIISLGDIAMLEDRAAEAIKGVSRPGGPHSQVTQG